MRISVVTVSREVGSPGDAVGYELAQRLGFNCINRGFVDLVARKARVAPWQVERIERVPPSGRPVEQEPPVVEYHDQHGRELDRLIKALGYGERMTSGEYLAALRQVIEDLANIGSVVIIGRGAQVVLRGRPEVYHVRVLAPRDERIAELQRIHGVDWEEAVAAADTVDGLRRELLAELGAEDPDERSLYDLTVNSSWKTIDECVDEVCAAMEARSAA